MLTILPQKRKALLILENGEVFYGHLIGAEGRVYGEIIFNTSMTGYQEVLSDPSYAGQIILFTFPHIGNVGINHEDQESETIWSKGVILRSFSSYYSNWRAEDSLEYYLKRNNVVGISEIDTRSLTITLRNSGSLWGVISSDVISIEDALVEIEKHKKQANGIVSAVSAPTIYEMEIADTNSHRIILYDFGTKKSIINYIARLNCNVIVVPWNTNFETVLNINPDGIILSNGPGDPNDCVEAIKSVTKFLQLGVPILGICLGHQILSLACDAKVYKMKYGHHGANHPIYNEIADKVSITSQNHNYAVDKTSLSNSLKVTHYSLFDGSIQGIKHKLKPAMGFQGHPEASPGPHDLIHVFQEFINMIDANKANQTFLQLRKNRYA